MEQGSAAQRSRWLRQQAPTHRGMGTSTSCPSARGLSRSGDSATALSTAGTACRVVKRGAGQGGEDK